MIGLLFLQAAAGVDGTPLGPLPRQALPAQGCAAFLWSAGAEHWLVALAGTDPAGLRLVIDGKPVDLPRLSAEGTGGFGLAGTTRYGGSTVTATLDVTVQARADLTGGAAVPAATLRLERPGADGIAMPVGGLIACATPTTVENH